MVVVVVDVDVEFESCVVDSGFLVEDFVVDLGVVLVAVVDSDVLLEDFVVFGVVLVVLTVVEVVAEVVVSLEGDPFSELGPPLTSILSSSRTIDG